MTRPGCYLVEQMIIAMHLNIMIKIDLIKKPGSIIIIGGSLSHYLNINAFDQVYFTKQLRN